MNCQVGDRRSHKVVFVVVVVVGGDIIAVVGAAAVVLLLLLPLPFIVVAADMYRDTVSK